MLTKKLNPALPVALADRGTGQYKADNMNIPDMHRHEGIQPLSPVTQEALDHMQHDIRSPLGAILGLSEILSAMAETPEEKKLAAVLKSSSADMNRQIETLFDALKTIKDRDKN